MTFSRPAKLASALLVSTSFLFGCAADGGPAPAKGDPTASSSASDLSRRIERLASDEFEGRAPSTPGGQAASQYIADEMAAAGLSPMGENGTFFQSVELTAASVLPTSTMSISNGETQVLDGNTTDNAVFWKKRLD